MHIPPDAPEANHGHCDQDQFNQAVLQACDCFSAIMEAGDYKGLVLAMLLLKYVSDVWQAGHDAQGLKGARFVVPASAHFSFLHAARYTAGNGCRIDNALRDLEEHNPETLLGAFQGIRFCSAKLGDVMQQDAILCRLLEDFSRIGLDGGGPDAFGHAFTFFIRHFAASSGKAVGESYTPPQVANLMALLAKPLTGEQCYDPACGSGSLLLACARLLPGVDTNGANAADALFGQEINGDTCALAYMNLCLHGVGNCRIAWGDTVNHPQFLASADRLRQFDVVLANPPFALMAACGRAAQGDRFGRFDVSMLPRARGDLVFIMHMVASMRPLVGRAIVVVPNGILHGRKSERAIRRKLLEENLLDAVIGLPKKLLHGTGSSAVILIFRHIKSDDGVLFVDAANDYQHDAVRNTLRQEDIGRIIAAVDRRADIAHYAYRASLREIAAKDYTLHIPRYVDSYVPKNTTDSAALAVERGLLNRELKRLDAELDTHCALLGKHEITARFRNHL